jgi:hypothetical protein
LISQRDSALALFATYVAIALRILYATYNGVVFFVSEIMLSCRSIGQRVDETKFKCVPKLTNFSGFYTTLQQEN